MHAPSGADAWSTNSSFLDIVHVDPWNSDVEQRGQRKIGRNGVDLEQLGQNTNPKDWNTSCQTSWKQNTSRATTQTCNSVRSSEVATKAKLEESWRPVTLAMIVQNKKSQSLLAYVTDLARDLHRRGGRVFLTFPWNLNVLTTWPIQSVKCEAPFLSAREGKKGILTNCVDTTRLVCRSRCCKSLVSLCLVQSSLAKICLSPMRCVCGTFQFMKI